MRRSFGCLPLLSILCMTAIYLTVPAPARSQTTFEIPRAAEPEMRPPQFTPPSAPLPGPRVEVPKSAPVVAPAGAEQVRFVLKGLDIEGVTVYPREVIEGLYKDSIGRQVSLKQIYEIAERIQRFYRKNGYFLARVIIPAQSVSATAGRLRVVVLEGYISKVPGPGKCRTCRGTGQGLSERPAQRATAET